MGVGMEVDVDRQMTAPGDCLWLQFATQSTQRSKPTKFFLLLPNPALCCHAHSKSIFHSLTTLLRTMTDQSHLSRSARSRQGQTKTKWPTLGPDDSQDHLANEQASLDPEREQDVPDEDDTQDIHRRHRGSSNDSNSQEEYQSSLPTAAEDPKTEFTLYDPTDGTQPLEDQTSLSPRSLGQGDAAGQMSQQSLIVQELENADEISQAGADGEPGDRGYGIHWGDVNPVPKVRGRDGPSCDSLSETTISTEGIEPQGAVGYLNMFRDDVHELV
ncbi:hypothetical protein HDK64DRAFT_258512 [Phyllosticta capitalensis]